MSNSIISNIKDGINSLVTGTPLSGAKAQNIMREIMAGEASDIEIASFLTALRIRGETPEVITGAAKIMREFSNAITPKVSGKLVDTCGTGGDGSNTFNISTLAAIVAAGAGVSIAKHGNRSVSSKCGSADILEAFGVKVDLDPKQVEQVIEKVGMGFMFAPKFHPAMKYAMPVRRKLAMRTIFNILGPLTNPASAKSHVLGVFDAALVKPMAEVMAGLDSEHVFVVHSEPGVDEILPIGKVFIGEAKNGTVKTYTLGPADFGLGEVTLDMVKGGDLEKNLVIAAAILTNKDQGIKSKIVEINAGYAILASGLAENITDARKKAADALISGAALALLKNLVIESGGDVAKFEGVFGK